MFLTFNTKLLLIFIMMITVLAVFLLFFFIKKKNSKKRKIIKLIFLPLLLIFDLIIFSVFYVFDYYKADEITSDYLGQSNHSQLDEDIDVKITDDYILFDGKGEDTALIFYPGAKVESEAYAPLLSFVASGMTDVYLLKTPMHLAILDIDQADEIDTSLYKHVYVAGHSMGGVVASIYASKNLDKLDGLILLAAYPTKSLKKDGFRVLSIVGDKDGGYDKGKWESYDKNMPDDYHFIMINGGNRANYAYYGDQEGDGKAEIPREEQVCTTCYYINKYLCHSPLEQ